MMFKEYVKRGVDLLDREIPNWRDKIDVEILNLRNTKKCIIGQLYPDNTFDDALEFIGIDWRIAGEYGFDVPLDIEIEKPLCYNIEAVYNELTLEWKKYL